MHEALHVNEKVSDVKAGLLLLGGGMTQPASQPFSRQEQTEQFYLANCTGNKTKQRKSSHPGLVMQV